MKNRTLKVLFIDDDLECLQGYLSALEPLHYDCTAEVNPQKGLALYKKALLQEQAKFDVVITDLRMPVLNGLELLASIQKLDKDARIILITAYADTHISKFVLEYNLYACFGKPLAFMDLLNTFAQIEKEIC